MKSTSSVESHIFNLRYFRVFKPTLNHMPVGEKRFRDSEHRRSNCFIYKHYIHDSYIIHIISYSLAMKTIYPPCIQLIMMIHLKLQFWSPIWCHNSQDFFFPMMSWWHVRSFNQLIKQLKYCPWQKVLHHLKPFKFRKGQASTYTMTWAHQ